MEAGDEPKKSSELRKDVGNSNIKHLGLLLKTKGHLCISVEALGMEA